MKIQDGKIVAMDSRNKPSVTLPMVYAALLVVLFRVVISGHFGYTDWDGSDFAMGLGAVGGIWLWREGQARSKPNV